MKTIKIKLVFEPEISLFERKEKLENWAKTMLKKERINVVEVEHFEKLSWIVVENSRIIERELNYA